VKHIAEDKLDDMGRLRRMARAKMAAAVGLFAVLICMASGVPALASTISLTDGNSVVVLDPSSSSGVSSWTVDGVNQLYQQWFWYRVGNGLQASIDTLGTPTVEQVTSSQASLSYTGSNGLTIKVTYLLTGGGTLSGAADLGESIAITNGGTAAQEVNFYQYSNFTLDNQASDDYVQFQNYNGVDQWKNVGHETLAETVITPRPNYRETGQILSVSASNYDANYDTLYKLNNVPGLTLRDPNTNTTSATLGPGDVTWAYQWDRTISPNSTFIISKDKALTGVLEMVPEPSSTALAIAASIALAAVARRRLRGR
jgi:hypothetical protein